MVLKIITSLWIVTSMKLLRHIMSSCNTCLHGDNQYFIFLFLMWKTKFDSSKQVWLNKTFNNKKTFHYLNRWFIVDIPNLKDKKITNIYGRGISITKMVPTLVCMEYGKKILSHWDQKNNTKEDFIFVFQFCTWWF